MAKLAKTINKQYDNHAKAFTKRSAMLHTTNVEALRRVVEFGDYSSFIYGANTLALTGIHRRAILLWMQKYGRCLMTIDSKTKTLSFTKKKGADLSTIDVDKADKSPFWADEGTDGRTDADSKVFNTYGRLKSLVSRRDKVAEDNTGYDMSKTDLGSDELMADIQAVIDKHNTANTTDTPVFDTARLRKVG